MELADIIGRVAGNTSVRDLPIQDMMTAFRINPNFLVTNHGIEDSFCFLVNHKGKTVEQATTYLQNAIAKLTTRGERWENYANRASIAAHSAAVASAYNDGPEASAQLGRPWPPVPKKSERYPYRKLQFRCLFDVTDLSLTDRIIFSWAWKWSYYNTTGKATKPLSIKRFRNCTGYRRETIRRSLAKLQQLGYLDQALQPDQGRFPDWKCTKSPAARYRNLRWVKSEQAEGINFTVLKLFVDYDRRKRGGIRSAGYYVKALGISRATFFRMMKKWEGTDETQIRHG